MIVENCVHAVCDFCGRVSRSFYSRDIAVSTLRSEDWLVNPDTGVAACELCRKILPAR